MLSRLLGREAEQLAQFLARQHAVADDVARPGAETGGVGGQVGLSLALAQLDDELLGAQQVGAERVAHDGDDAEGEETDGARHLAAPPVNDEGPGQARHHEEREAAADQHGGDASTLPPGAHRCGDEVQHQQKDGDLTDRSPWIAHADGHRDLLAHEAEPLRNDVMWRKLPLSPTVKLITSDDQAQRDGRDRQPAQAAHRDSDERTPQAPPAAMQSAGSSIAGPRRRSAGVGAFSMASSHMAMAAVQIAASENASVARASRLRHQTGR